MMLVRRSFDSIVYQNSLTAGFLVDRVKFFLRRGCACPETRYCPVCVIAPNFVALFQAVWA